MKNEFDTRAYTNMIDFLLFDMELKPYITTHFYSKAIECQNTENWYACFQCGKCGRRFEKDVMVDDGGTHFDEMGMELSRFDIAVIRRKE